MSFLLTLRNGLPDLILTSEEEMIAFGRKLSKSLQKGDLLLLQGTLGAGKTTVVKGILKEFAGIDSDEVQSPTYTYVHPYSGKCPLFHFDLYRLEDEKTFFDLDLDAYLSCEGIAIIEWPERVPSIPSFGRKITIEITHLEQGRGLKVRGLE